MTNITRPAGEELRALVRRLADSGGEADGSWRGWKLSRLTGGANNLLYRAQRDGADYVVKFTIRDERNRALDLAERQFSQV